MDTGMAIQLRPKRAVLLVVLALFMGVLGVLVSKRGYFGFDSFLTLLSPKKVDFNLAHLRDKQTIMPVAIIGSGPAGLTAGIYGARGGFRTYVFEGSKPGGLLTETTDVENWPGENLILGPELIGRMHKQAENLGVTFVADVVEAIDTSSWPYKLSLESGKQAYALSIIIATGATPRRLGIPGEQEYWGYGVTTCAICDAAFRKGQDVIVIGGGDSAIEEAIQLATHVRKVTIMVRKDAMRAAARMQDRLAGFSNIEIKYNVDVTEIVGEKVETQYGPVKRVTAVKVYDNKENRAYIMEDIRGVFLAIGHVPNSQLFAQQIDCNELGYITVEEGSRRTSQPGIFAAGDVADHVYRQAITSAGFGCMAMLETAAFLGEVGFNEEIAAFVDTRGYTTFDTDESAVYNAANLKELRDIFGRAAGKPVVVDFYGQTCPSCLQMLPVYEQVAHELKEKALFIKVDVDEAEDIVRAYDISSVPCLLVFKDGQPQQPIYRTMRRKELMLLAQETKK